MLLDHEQRPDQQPNLFLRSQQSAAGRDASRYRDHPLANRLILHHSHARKMRLVGDPDLQQNRITVPARSIAPLRQAVTRLEASVHQPVESAPSKLSIQPK